MFVFFLTCSVLVVSKKFPAVSSRDLKGRQGYDRQRTFNSEFRSPPRKRYSRYMFSGPGKRSLNSETSDQDRKVRFKNRFKVFLVFFGVFCLLSVLKLLSLWEYAESNLNILNVDYKHSLLMSHLWLFSKRKIDK